jgi:hypothetical protein
MTSKYIYPIPNTIKSNKYKTKAKPLPTNCWVDQPEVLPAGSTKIELSRGYFAIVDEEDVPFLEKFNWSLKPDGGTAYAITRDQSKTEFKMHKVIMKVNNGEDIHIDHINHNGVDNRKANLRIISRADNQLNRRERTKEKNRFIGVLPALSGNNFTAWIPLTSGKVKKNFDDEVIAARYYDYMVTQDKGPTVKTNLSKGRFTQQELESFGGKISNPLEEVEVAADIKYQSNMVCLTANEFKKMVHKLADKEKPQLEAFTKDNVVTICSKIPDLERTEDKDILVGDLLKILWDKDPTKKVLLESKNGLGVLPVDFTYFNSENDFVLSLDEDNLLQKSLAESQSRVTLLEETLRTTEAELKRANQIITELGL